MLSVLFVAACRSSAPSGPGPEGIQLEGMASWYGAEFEGRPTANGEIFDPMTMTAAHRTLPFGTIVDVTNLKNGRSTRVRINDRGPFVGNRIIDLSYAAARSLDMVEDGVSRVRLEIVRLGKGDREPPQPYSVTIRDEPTESVPDVSPSPEPVRTIDEAPVSVGGRTMTPASELIPETANPPRPAQPDKPEQTPAEPTTSHTPATTPTPAERSPVRTAPPPPAPAPTAATPVRGWKVQLGAFGVEENARRLAREISTRLSNVYVENVGGLFRVRVGPFSTKPEAIDASERVHSLGYEAIVLSPDAR